MTPSEDPRIQRTYTLLMAALTKLLTEKNYDAVSVKDICETAGIHRSTFYAHFEGKEHLLTFGLQELLDELTLSAASPLDRARFLRAMRRTFRYFQKNRQEYTRLFVDPKNAGAKQLYQDVFSRALHPLFRQALPDATASEAKLCAHFFTGGLLATVTQWLKEDCRPTPEDMTENLARFLPSPPGNPTDSVG